MSRHVQLRVKASNAIVALVDFNASAMATAEGEISQKDSFLAQMAERIATLEAEKRVETQRVDSLLESLEKASEEAAELRATIEADRIAPRPVSTWEKKVRVAIMDLLRERDSMKDGSPIDRLDTKMNALRSLGPLDP